MVIDAGAKAGAVPGKRVIAPFQLSCGRRDACRKGLTVTCTTTRGLQSQALLRMQVRWPTFGRDACPFFGDFMLVKLPDGVDPLSVASFPDSVADAGAFPVRWRIAPGATVLVRGLAQSVSLYAAASAVSG